MPRGGAHFPNLEAWYPEHPCADRFRYDPKGPYLCHAMKEGCYKVLCRGICPRDMKLPPKQETFTLEPGKASVVIPRDIPAGTYELKKVS